MRIFDNYYRCDRRIATALAAMDRVEVVEGDIRYANAIEGAIKGVEAVVHLAAVCINKSISDPTESLDVNLLGTQNVFDAAARGSVQRIVYASSASIYGNPTAMPMRETDKPAPITPYCIAKLAGEHLLSFYAERSRMSWLALRFFNVYGPGQPTDAYYTSVVLTFLRRLAAAVAELADHLIKALGAEVQPVFRPREVLVAKREASTERVREVLDWEPTVELTEGLATVVEHLKVNGELS